MTTVDENRALRDFLAAMPLPMAYLDPQYRLVYCNSCYHERFRVEPAAGEKLDPTVVVSPESVRTIRPHFERALGGTESSFEGVITYHNRGERAVALRYVPDRADDGTVKGVFVIHQDVASERQRELTDRLRTSENHLRLILDSSQHGVWGLDTTGRVTFINRSAVELLGYADASELIGQRMHELVHHTFADGRPHHAVACPIHDTIHRRNTHHIPDDVLWRKDGTSFPVSYYSTPVIENDACVGAVVTFEDTSVQRTLESSLEIERTKNIRTAKLASLGEMSAGIAHEINNPLAIVTGTVSLLSKFREAPEEFAKKIETIKKSCARIARIVKGLQKFSRTGDAPNFQTHRLDKILAEAILLTEPKARRHATTVSIEGQSTSLVRCDEVEIEQVVINLINNAVDAVKTRAERWVKMYLSEDDETVTLRVTDSGTGISEDVRNRLFEPFFTTKDVGKGTGLGLSIVKGILDEHRATITVVAEDAHTCFELRFPRAQENQHAS